MARITDTRPPTDDCVEVPSQESPYIALVGRDPDLRLDMARAFDSAPTSWRVELHDDVPEDADVVVIGPEVDYSGGIRFDQQRPDAVIEAIRALTRPKPGALTVVTSAVGGTGATSIALHLAACGDRETSDDRETSGDRETSCFVDFDTCFGAAHRLGLLEKHLTWRDVGSSMESLMLAAIPFAGGFRALLSPGDGSSPEEPGSLLDRAVASFDRVVVDVPNGPLLDVALQHCRAAVLVMTPDRVSALRSKALLGAHTTTRWAVVTNRIGPGGEATKTTLQKIVGLPIAIELPCAPGLRDAADEGRLLASRFWRYTRGISRLHSALASA